MIGILIKTNLTDELGIGTPTCNKVVCVFDEMITELTSAHQGKYVRSSLED